MIPSYSIKSTTLRLSLKKITKWRRGNLKLRFFCRLDSQKQSSTERKHQATLYSSEKNSTSVPFQCCKTENIERKVIISLPLVQVHLIQIAIYVYLSFNLLFIMLSRFCEWAMTKIYNFAFYTYEDIRF